MELSQLPIDRFTDALSGKEPTPGGGGACALVGAVGVSLGHMVGSLTVGKKKYASVEPDMRRAMEQAARLQKELLALMDGDAEAFLPLAAAYRLPSDTPEQRAEKVAAMEPALRLAAAAPLSILEKCCEALDLMERFAAFGSPLAVSDAGVGAALCWAALTGAAMNVWINTKLMTDQDHAHMLNARTDELLALYTKKADAITASVSEQLKTGGTRK